MQPYDSFSLPSSFSSFSRAFFCTARDPTPPTYLPLPLTLFPFLVASCLQSGANIFLVNRPLLDRYSWLPLCASRTSRGLLLCRRQCRARTHARMHARKHETSYPTSQPAIQPGIFTCIFMKSLFRMTIHRDEQRTMTASTEMQRWSVVRTGDEGG